MINYNFIIKNFKIYLKNHKLRQNLKIQSLIALYFLKNPTWKQSIVDALDYNITINNQENVILDKIKFKIYDLL